MKYTKIYKSKKRELKKIRLRKRLLQLSVFTLIFLAALTCVLVLSCSAVKTNAAVNNSVKYYKSITIKSGDTLWSIASEYMDSNNYSDEREYIKELCSINNIETDNIKCGMNLIVPYYVYE